MYRRRGNKPRQQSYFREAGNPEMRNRSLALTRSFDGGTPAGATDLERAYAKKKAVQGFVGMFRRGGGGRVGLQGMKKQGGTGMGFAFGMFRRGSSKKSASMKKGGGRGIGYVFGMYRRKKRKGPAHKGVGLAQGRMMGSPHGSFRRRKKRSKRNVKGMGLGSMSGFAQAAQGFGQGAQYGEAPMSLPMQG